MSDAANERERIREKERIRLREAATYGHCDADRRVAGAEADRDTAEEERDQLIKLITLNGFTVMRGDFMLRDGTHSAFHVRPTDVRRLLNNALVALNRPED